MTLFRVEIEETQTRIVFIDAANERDAVDTGEEVASLLDPNDTDVDSYAKKVDLFFPGDTEQVWYGGPEGDWITYGEYRRLVRGGA